MTTEESLKKVMEALDELAKHQGVDFVFAVVGPGIPGKKNLSAYCSGDEAVSGFLLTYLIANMDNDDDGWADFFFEKSKEILPQLKKMLKK